MVGRAPQDKWCGRDTEAGKCVRYWRMMGNVSQGVATAVGASIQVEKVLLEKITISLISSFVLPHGHLGEKPNTCFPVSGLPSPWEPAAQGKHRDHSTPPCSKFSGAPSALVAGGCLSNLPVSGWVDLFKPGVSVLTSPLA